MWNEELEKDSYIRRRAEFLQKSVINDWNSDSPTITKYLWTYRNTNCDVVSVITTILPIVDGKMKDMKLNEKETMKLKPPLKRPGKNHHISGSPFEDGLVVDIERSKKRVSSLLKSERTVFLEKLNYTKFLRTALENRAAIIIQKIWRGRFVRNCVNETVRQIMIEKKIRSHIKQYLASKGVSISHFKHRENYSNIRKSAATKIQNVFRKFISRKTIFRKWREALEFRRRQAAIIIQCLFRCKTAKKRIIYLASKQKNLAVHQSATRIQVCWRRLMAKRRVRIRRIKLRWLAARMIQCWFRSRHSRKLANAIKDLILRKRIFKGAQKIQCAVRKFLSRHRMRRVRYRFYFQLFSNSAIKIQAVIRRFIARRRFPKHSVSVIAARAVQQDLENALMERSEVQRKATEAADIEDSMNIYRQFALQNYVQVEDLIVERIQSGLSMAEEVSSTSGNSILHLSAEAGQLEMVRKSLLWGFDINTRNLQGLTPLLLAAKNHHLSIVQYLLNLPPTESWPSTAVLQPLSDSDTYQLLAFAVDTVVVPPAAAAAPATAVPAATPGRRASVSMSGKLASIGSSIAGTSTSAIAAAASAATRNSLALLNSLILFGLNVNAVQEETEMTALLAACEVGNFEAVKVLLKNRAGTDVNDVDGQTPLHKASKSSPDIVRGLLGLDNSLSVVIPELTRASYLLSTDNNGKSCALLAALNGQKVILDIIYDVVQKTPVMHLPAAYAELSPPVPILFENTDEDIGWSPADIECVLRLAKNNQVFCFEKVLEAGFDPLWSLSGEGKTAVHIAAQYGSMEVLDVLMSRSVDFSHVDVRGRNVFHYAAMATSTSVSSSSSVAPPAPSSSIAAAAAAASASISLSTFTPAQQASSAIISHLLSHSCTSTCKLHADMLAATDNEGCCPIHILAQEGCEISFELLAASGLEKAWSVANHDGMTPLLVASSYVRHSFVKRAVDLGAPLTSQDYRNHDCIWHLFHPLYRLSSFSTNHPHHPTYLHSPPSTTTVTPGPSRHGSLNATLRHTNSSINGSFSTSNELHSNRSTSSSTSFSNAIHMQARYPLCSEYWIRKIGGLTAPRRDRDEERARLTKDVELLLFLLRRGCSLFSPSSMITSPDRLLALPISLRPNSGVKSSSPLLRNLQLSASEAEELLDSGDILVRELGFTALKELPAILSAKECWRLALSCIRFDDGSNKALFTLLDEGQAVPSLARINPSFLLRKSSQGTSIKSSASIASTTVSVAPFMGGSGGNTPTVTSARNSGAAMLDSLGDVDTNGDVFSPSQMSSRSDRDGFNLSVEDLRLLQGCFFGGYTIVGWIIRLGNASALHQLLHRGYEVTAPTDMQGNACIHAVATLQTANAVGIVDIILNDPSALLEQVNRNKQTAAMIAAQQRNFPVMRKLYRRKADLRRALEVRFEAWILAWVKTREKCEKNTQTGRIGDDDERYCPMEADYRLWL